MAVPPCNFAIRLQFFTSIVSKTTVLLQILGNRLDACKRESFFLLFDVAQFLSPICLRVQPNFFIGRMTVASGGRAAEREQKGR